MLRFGVIGLGFMGRAHLASLAGQKGVVVRAVSDILSDRLHGKLRPEGGNLETGGRDWDESGLRRCADARQVMGDADIDAVVVAVPSYLHADMAVFALQAGKHVFVEKPMALNVEDCDRMLAAASGAGKVLMVGHVLRFWPEYTVAAELARAGRYGQLRALLMSRRGAAPRFGARDWFLDHTKSGGGLLDLHIHDIDFALSLLGMPRALQAAGRIGLSGGYDHVMCSYDYGDSSLMVHAEASWTPGKDSPFAMSFRMELEQATLLYSSDAKPPLALYDAKGQPALKVLEGSGYLREIQHFIECVRAGAESTIASASSSRNSVAVALAEAQSIRSGQKVEL